jgi:hypothetical protein
MISPTKRMQALCKLGQCCVLYWLDAGGQLFWEVLHAHLGPCTVGDCLLHRPMLAAGASTASLSALRVVLGLNLICLRDCLLRSFGHPATASYLLSKLGRKPPDSVPLF